MELGLFLPILALGGLLGFAVYTSDPGDIAVDPIYASGFVTYNGYTPKTLATMLIGEINYVQTVSNSSRGSRYQSQDQIKEQQLEAVSESLDIGQPLKVLQLTLGLIPLKITGAVVDKGEELQIMLTGYKSDGKVIKIKRSVPADKPVDYLMREAALGLFEEIEPYVAATYYFRTERGDKKFTKTRRLTRQALVSGNRADLPWFYNLLGRVLSEEGRYDDAIVQFREALKIDPTFQRAHLHWGRALVRKGQLPEAEGEFRTALLVDPTYADAHVELGILHAARGEPVRAMEEYALALSKDARHAFAYAKWAELLIARGRRADGIEALRRAVAIDPKDKGFQKALEVVLAGENPAQMEMIAAN